MTSPRRSRGRAAPHPHDSPVVSIDLTAQIAGAGGLPGALGSPAP